MLREHERALEGLALNPLPPEIERFVVDNIESVQELEILLLLRANHRREWTGEAVARELRCDPRTSAERLIDLQRRGLVVPSPSSANAMVYAASKTDADHALRALASFYPSHRNTIIALILSKPTTKLESFPEMTRPPPGHRK